MPAPPEPAALHGHLLAGLASATASAARILQVLLDDPAGAAQLTVTGLAARTRTSEATVVRTARSLGFAGYPQLRLALAASAAGPAAPSAQLAGGLDRSTDVATIVATLAAVESEALAATASTLDVRALTAAADAVAAARVVDCYGIGTSALVAQDFDHKASRVGLVTRVRTEGHAALVSSTLLAAGDVALVVSHSGATPDVVTAARQARDAGATVVAVTGSAGTPLARQAHHVLRATGRETALRAGAMAARTSSLLIVDALYVAVVQRLGDPADAALQATFRAVDGVTRAPRRPRR